MTAFAAVAEPSRRRILDQLLAGERSVNELVERLDMPQPAVSKHLRVLRDAGIVSARVDASNRRYSIHSGGLAEIEAWLAPYRKLWARRLDALERHLEKNRRGRKRAERKRTA